MKRKDLKYHMLEVKNQEKQVKSPLLQMMKSKMPKAITSLERAMSAIKRDPLITKQKNS